ncbi:MAG: glucuronate isomerase [Candidatus Ancillula sp.]|jgi:glucuronate isomerase|nr:glucuronate isomerase [Candidatus Ancillula sp.]
MSKSSDFLLSSKKAQKLYDSYAKNLKIVDSCSSFSSREICENLNFENITKLWISNGVSGDNHKLDLMRKAGIQERQINGDASDWEKFNAFVKTLELSYANPVYERSLLELQKYFGLETTLDSKNAENIWNTLNAKLATDEYKPRSIIAKSNVDIIITEDDLTDSLEYHRLLSIEEKRFRVLPGWSPRRVLNISSKNFTSFILELSISTDVEIEDLESLETAIRIRMNYFSENGCSIAIHDLENFCFEPSTSHDANCILEKVLAHKELSTSEIAKYYAYIQKFLLKEYARRDWTLQMYGGSSKSDKGISSSICNFFKDLQKQNLNANCNQIFQPRVILYSSDIDNYYQLIALNYNQKFRFGGELCENSKGVDIFKQLEVYANVDLLGNFIQAHVNAQSFIGLAQHDYFRRAFCNFLADLMSSGRIRKNSNSIRQLVENVCYMNAKRQLGL